MLKQPEPFFFEHGQHAVILLHAYAGSANDVRMLARALEREDYTVYGPNSVDTRLMIHEIFSHRRRRNGGKIRNKQYHLCGKKAILKLVSLAYH
ncbi:hypothetical protein TUA1478L_03840 [Lactiplantibacillus plantarum]